MSAVTYSDGRVKEYLNRHFVPVRLHCDFEQPSAEMRRYGIKWTPTLLVLDEDGQEQHRSEGYLTPKELMAQLSLGMAKLNLAHEAFEPATRELAQVLESCPECATAPEARYFLGVSRYRQTHDLRELRRTWEVLARDFPQSEWTRKAEPYSQID